MLADRPWSLARRASEPARRAMQRDSGGGVKLAVVMPEILHITQSDFPLPGNDGPLWAGRGRSWSVTTGVAVCAGRGRFGAIIAPTFWRARNDDFALVSDPRIVPPQWAGASPWASPYHDPRRSLDQPRRFADRPLEAWDAGVLAAWWRTDALEVGVTTEPEWWGPGLRNALLLSSQSAGVPRAYVGTARPLNVAGALEFRAFLGQMSWSRFFRAELPADSARSLSGAIVTWRPRFEPRLQVGVARLVAAPTTGGAALLGHVLDVLRPVGTPNARPLSDGTVLSGPDQLFSAFAHWRLPDDGTELWLEWGRAEQPANLADILRAPQHSRAITIGLQHVRALPRPGWHARVAFEYTGTGQTGTYRERPSGSWYTSRAVLGGFTQRGQVLGAAMGSGSTGQWAALDVGAPRGSLGVFLQRVKWDDDTFYTIPRPNGNGLCKHDVSLAWGLRALAALPGLGQLETTVASQQRMNLYWQALGLCFANEELQVDARNVTIDLRWRPSFLRF